MHIIFDTDMGSDCDDVGALALLHAYADKKKAEIIGCVYSSGKIPYGASVIEAINIYRGRHNIPVGAYYGDDIGDQYFAVSISSQFSECRQALPWTCPLDYLFLVIRPWTIRSNPKRTETFLFAK